MVGIEALQAEQMEDEQALHMRVVPTGDQDLRRLIRSMDELSLFGGTGSEFEPRNQ